MSTAPVNTAQREASQFSAGADEALRGLDLGDFVNLIIAELQNQDPLNPLDNSEMLNQLSQIREIDSTTKLSETLDSVLLGQNLAMGSSLIGKKIEALATDDFGNNAQRISGRVDRVLVEDGTIRLRVGGRSVSLNNISEIVADDPETDATEIDDTETGDAS